MILIRKRSLFLLIVIVVCLLKWITAGNKVYKVERSGNCPKVGPNYNMSMDFSGFGKINELQGFRFTGAINITNDVRGLLSLRVIAQRCNLHGFECSTFLDEFFDNFCPHLLNGKYVGDAFTKITIPPFKCPIKEGLHVATNYLVDLSRLDFLPIDNLKWIVTHEWFDYDAKKINEDKRRPLGCWLLELTRTTTKNRKRGG